MASAANITGVTNIATSVAAIQPPPTPTVASSIARAVKPDATPVSPQFKYDPSAGLIIQYLNGSGQVEAQIPSATVVAYLRAGLTAQGFPQSQNTEA